MKFRSKIDEKALKRIKNYLKKKAGILCKKMILKLI